MRKILPWIKNNLLFLETLVLLAFIPLYPKLPLINVKNTWVYVRVEDFLILAVLFSWLILLFRKKVSLRTPLTIPILVFWIIGAIATIHGVLLIFPTLTTVFPNVAFLSLVRHIEYLSLFFIAFHGFRDKKFLNVTITVIIATLLVIVFYGFGQRYLEFPAFLTSNEEFAKGIPITLSQLSRVPSTFAGHYDLAAYLVLIIPLVVSLMFGIKNWLLKIFLGFTTILSFALLFMTVSRVSFFVVFISLFLVFFFQKRKLVFLAVPLLIIGAFVFLAFKPTILQRFQHTVSEVNVLVDADTGNSVGHVEFVPNTYFEDKIVLQQRITSEDQLVKALKGSTTPGNSASLSAILPFEYIPKQVVLVKAVDLSTGESLPQGTGYINLALSPAIKRTGNFFYEFPPNIKSSPSAQFIVLHGNFIIKRAAAYDLSFTTRFQGEWPRAIEAFQRNILLGSGYGSVSLAVDNNYLRILGETGILGLVAFFAIFLSFFIYLKKSWAGIESGIQKSFLIGFIAGVFGLALNATLIDVFEASKIAYTLWLLMGVALGVIVLNLKSPVNLSLELRKAATSVYAVIVYLFTICTVMYLNIVNNFFIGDDFTWLRWAAQAPSNILTYFIKSDGFFYRPGTKIYFDFMYHFFWLNPNVYHLVSIFLHFAVSVIFFIIAKKIFKSTLLSAFAAFLFLILSGYSEMVLWIASTGYLFNALFGLLGLLFFVKWDESKNKYYYLVSLASFALALLFHELGVVLPLLILAYKAKESSLQLLLKTIRRKDFLLLFVPVGIYLLLRLISNSHWLAGDYSYNLVKLPFNVAGNLIGYGFLSVFGPIALNFYEKLRDLTRVNLLLTIAIIPIFIAIFYGIYKSVKKIFEKEEISIIIAGLSLFVVSLLPFLGLGNITSRYSYLASAGIALVLVVFVRKFYNYLLFNGKELAIGIVCLVVMVYSLFHIISLQQTQADWAGASTKVNNFFISFDSAYNDYWSQEPIEFHVVNLPTKWGQAWVFPAGIQDAVWFAVKNDNAKIYLDKDVDTALNSVGSSLKDKIFVFNDDGSLREISERKMFLNLNK